MTLLDQILETACQGYITATGLAEGEIENEELLQWCLDEITDTYDSENVDSAMAYQYAINAMDKAITDIQSIVEALTLKAMGSIPPSLT